MKVPVGGGSATTLASGQSYPFGIAVDGMNVYWINSCNGGCPGTVMTVPLGGGTIATLATGQQNANGIAVDTTSVCWANYIIGGAVMKVAKP